MASTSRGTSSEAANADGDSAPQYEEGRITVVVRSRPFNDREHALKSSRCLEFSQCKSLTIYENGVPSSLTGTTACPSAPDGSTDGGDTGGHRPHYGRTHTFAFDFAYEGTVPQDRVYADVGKPVLASSLRGFNTCIFAYGQTGSGKSYAMMGPSGGRDSAKEPGIIPRLCTDLFEQKALLILQNAQQREEALADGMEVHQLQPSLSIHVDVSYLEIYQEKVKCLLKPKKENLKVRQHPALGVYVEGLTEVTVEKYDDVLQLMNAGNNSRHTASTNMNDRSSRSHAIFAIQITQRRVGVTKDGEESTTVIRSKMNLVDLAGSERAKSTGAEGDTLREGAQINKSLTVLGLVISGLAEASKSRGGGTGGGKTPFIPYRDSMLTYLLKESLGGNSKTFMISTLSPATVNYEETLSTLRYADRAKSIVTRATVNESAGDKRIRELEDEVSQLREKLKQFQEMVQTKEKLATLVPKLNLEGIVGEKPWTREGKVPVGFRSSSSEMGRLSAGAMNPRTAIDRVAVGSRSGPGSENGESYPPLVTPREPQDAAILQEQLHCAEEIMYRLSAPDEERERESERLLNEYRSQSTVKAVRQEPYLLNVEGAGDWIIEHMVDEVTHLGTAHAAIPTDSARYVVVSGVHTRGVGAPHCSLIKRSDGTVWIRPYPGCRTVLDDGTSLAEEVQLLNGSTICIGDEQLQFKFIDPASEVPATARKRRNQADQFDLGVRQELSGTLPVEADSATGLGVSPRVVIPPSLADSASASVGGVAHPSGLSPSHSPPPQRPNDGELHADDLGSPHVGYLERFEPSSSIGPTQGTSDAHVNPELLGQLDRVPESNGVESLGEAGAPILPSVLIAPEVAQGSSGGEVVTTASVPALAIPRRDGNAVSVAASRSVVVSGRRVSSKPAGERSGRGAGGSANLAGTPTRHVKISSSTGTRETLRDSYRHTFLLMGMSSAGKTSLRANLAKEDRWLQFMTREKMVYRPTFGVESSRVTTGQLQRAEMTLTELGGNHCFNLLQDLLPNRRVTYLLCYNLTHEITLQLFRDTLEFILCQTTSRDTSVVLVGTHRDLVPLSDADLGQLLSDLEMQIGNFFRMLQPNTELRPTIIGRFAVSNVDRTVFSPSAARLKRFPDMLCWLGEHAVQRCRIDVDFPNCLIPARIFTLANRLNELGAAGKWIITAAEYKAIARGVDPRYGGKIEELHVHTQLLHSWGVLHHHYKHLQMRRHIILDIAWVMRLFAALCCCRRTDTVYRGGKAAATVAESRGEDGEPLILAPGTWNAFKGHLPVTPRASVGTATRVMLQLGIVSSGLAEELFSGLLAEKKLDVDQLADLLQLLESYDLIIAGSRIQLSRPTTLKAGEVVEAGRAVDLEAPNTSEREVDEETTYEGASGGTSAGDSPASTPTRENFYAIPSCFFGQPPSALTVHLPDVLFGPFYRFKLNMVPQSFFSRVAARVAHYSESVYLGPVTRADLAPSRVTDAHGNPTSSFSTDRRSMETATSASDDDRQFWSNTAWVVSSPTSRAFLRMVRHTLFIMFHDHSDDEEFHNGLRNVVQNIIGESPGAVCQEALLCTTCVMDEVEKIEINVTSGAVMEEDDIQELRRSGHAADVENGMLYWRSIDENINSLEKIRERENAALRTARARSSARDYQGHDGSSDDDGDCDDDYETEGTAIIPFIRNREEEVDVSYLLSRIISDSLLTDGVFQRVDKALRLIGKGRASQDSDRGKLMEGRGIDELVDALANA